MFLSDISLKRPVLAISMSIGIIMLGIMSSLQLTVREYPAVSQPHITIKTNYSGASADVVEQRVTKVLEQELGGIEGLDVMRSTSNTSTSAIDLSFRPGTDVGAAAASIRERIARVKGELPDDVKDPSIHKLGANDQPFLWLMLSSDTQSVMETTQYALAQMRPYLQSMDGVAAVVVYGDYPTLQVQLQPEKMAELGVSPSDVVTMLKSNVQSPAGYVITKERNISVVVDQNLNTPAHYQKLPLRASGGRIITLSDVADVFVGPDNGPFRWEPEMNGKKVTILGIQQATDGNPLVISKNVRAWMGKAQHYLPKGMTMDVSYDASLFIDKSLWAVGGTIAEASILVMLIILFFLHSPKASLIPMVTIPISLMGSLVCMAMLGYSINTITLLAMVLAIGLVVDDAIVMMENIHRYRAQGLGAKEAALKGSREIAFSIVAMTITLAIVYMPIAFMSGATGQYFAEFAVSLAGAVLVSGFVALTLTPVMCERLLSHHGGSGLGDKIESYLQGLLNTIHSAISRTLGHPKIILSVVALVFVGVYTMVTTLPTMLAPPEDRGMIMAAANGPEGATVEFMNEHARAPLVDIIKSDPDITNVFSMSRMGSAFIFATMKPWQERTRSQFDVLGQLTPKVNQIPAVRAYVFPPESPLTGGGEGGISYVVRTFGSYEDLDRVMQKFIQTIREKTPLKDARHSLKMGTPQYKLTIDQDKAHMYKVQQSDIQKSLSVMLGGTSPVTFERDGQFYDVVVRIGEQYRHSLDTLSLLYVKQESTEGDNTLNPMIPLQNVVTAELKTAPNTLEHFNQMRSATMNAALPPGASLGDILASIDTIADATLPAAMMRDVDGFARTFLESNYNMILIFVAALAFIYLVLAVQFESFIDPLIILISVPLSLFGALAALWATKNSLNIFSEVGLVTLIGLITKHGILLVDFANKRLDMGSPKAAIQEALKLRLRPILMTTGAMVLGAIPLAFASGAGAEARQQIGWVLVGGLSIGTLFTLFVVPSIYIMFKEMRINKGR